MAAPLSGAARALRCSSLPVRFPLASLHPQCLSTCAGVPHSRLRQHQQVRHATHTASGRANKAKDGPGKRLGAKKTAGEKVRTGMIIYRQRGTVWFPGENAGIGRDHTIFALQPGYVRYYRDPKQPKRKFIGIALTKDQKMPRPLNAARVRRLEWEEAPLVEPPERRPFGTKLTQDDLVRSDGYYVYRPPNWKIGRVMPKLKWKKRNPFAKWQRKVKIKSKLVK